jgi:hypothetical protein
MVSSLFLLKGEFSKELACPGYEARFMSAEKVRRRVESLLLMLDPNRRPEATKVKSKDAIPEPVRP